MGWNINIFRWDLNIIYKYIIRMCKCVCVLYYFLFYLLSLFYFIFDKIQYTTVQEKSRQADINHFWKVKTAWDLCARDSTHYYFRHYYYSTYIPNSPFPTLQNNFNIKLTKDTRLLIRYNIIEFASFDEMSALFIYSKI